MESMPISSSTSPPTSVQMLHALIRFARVARFRWTLIAAVLLACGLAGGLYYATVDRVYQARAQVLVQQTGPVVTSNGSTDGLNQQGMLPTYERLFTSTVVLEGAISNLMDLPRELRGDLIQFPRESWVAVLRDRVTVRSIRLTNVLEVSYGASSPESAEAVVKALLDSYMRFMKSNHETVAGELVAILQTERLQVEQQLKEKETKLIEAKRAFGDIGLRDQTQTLHPLVQRVVRLNENLIEVQQNRLKLEATLVAVRDALATGRDVRQHLFAIEPVIGREVVLAALGLSQQDEETVARLEQKLIDEQAERDSLQNHYGDRHPKLVQLGESIQQTQVYLANYQEAVSARAQRMQEQQLGTMLENLLSQEQQKYQAQESILRRQYEAAQREAVLLHGRFEEIAMLQREVDRLLNFNHTLLDHINSIDINQNQSDVRAEVVSRPQAGKSPVSPNAAVVIVMSLLSGCCGGAALVYIADVLDDRFRSPEEMKLQLQTQVLAMIRRLETHADSGIESLQVFVAPDAVDSEAFRTLRTTLAFSSDDLECVAISSSEPGDGKTTVAANLGVAIAQTGRRTLLIDADLRRPGLTKLFQMKGVVGLSEWLRNAVEEVPNVQAIVKSTPQAGLEVIPSGARPVDPTGLLSSARFAELLSWAVSHYDQVIIDSPPALVASDAAIVGRMAGGLMLVVQPQKNHRRLVVRAVEEIRSTGLNLIGVIVNKLSNEGGQAYYGEHYGYGYGYGDVDSADDLEASGDLPGEASVNELIARASLVEGAPPSSPRRAA